MDLQLLTFLVSSGTLVTMIGAGIAYGKLTQKVDGHDDKFEAQEKRIDRVEGHLFPNAPLVRR